jgi:hypothetical protein
MRRMLAEITQRRSGVAIIIHYRWQLLGELPQVVQGGGAFAASGALSNSPPRTAGKQILRY